MTDIFVAIGAALVSGLVMYFFGYRKAGKARGTKETKGRLIDIKVAQGVRNEVETLDDIDLADRARRWVRGNSD
jgi:hypothetical protein